MVNNNTFKVFGCSNNRIIMVLIDRFSYVIGVFKSFCVYGIFCAWFKIVFLYEAVVLVWNEVVIWNSQINNWMQLASVLELPVNIIYKDATRIYVTIQKYMFKFWKRSF